MEKPTAKPKWTELAPGAAIIDPGSARWNRTGDWRSSRPVWDTTKCIKCGICYMFCPDSAVCQKTDGYYEANLEYCKGCGICARECFTGCIAMIEEAE